jgi:oligopeptide transport system permease protein
MTLSLTNRPLEKKVKNESLWADSLNRLLKNKAAVIGLFFIVVLTIASIFANKLATHPYDLQSLPDQNNIPQWLGKIFPKMAGYVHYSSEYILGSDMLGRDVFSRILYGGRVSLTIALFAPLLSLLIGITYGSISGYSGGKIDMIMMRIVDVLYAFPSLLFIILLMTLFKGASKAEAGTVTYYIGSLDARLNGILFIFVGIGFTSWQTMARLTRGQVLFVRNKEYVESARTIGATNFRIIFKL